MALLRKVLPTGDRAATATRSARNASYAFARGASSPSASAWSESDGKPDSSGSRRRGRSPKGACRQGGAVASGEEPQQRGRCRMALANAAADCACLADAAS